MAAVGQTSQLVATESVTPEPGLLVPTTATAGSIVQIQGSNFGQNETITIQLLLPNGTTQTVATPQSDTNGAFETSFTTPLVRSVIGRQLTVIATGNTSGALLSEPFTPVSVIQITPNTGSSGTTITLTGQGFLPSSSVPVIWDDPNTASTIFLVTVTTDSNGQFTQTITVPDGLVSGATYYVEALASYLQYVKVAFTAQ